MTHEILNYLKTEPRFRERKNKWRGIADLIIKKYNIDIDRRKLADILADGSSADRAWRMALKENSDLRGQDYAQKEILVQNKQIELGYEPFYRKDITKLKSVST